MTEYRCHECGSLLNEQQRKRRIRSSNIQLWFVYGGTTLIVITSQAYNAVYHPERLARDSYALSLRHLFISP